MFELRAQRPFTQRHQLPGRLRLRQREAAGVVRRHRAVPGAAVGRRGGLGVAAAGRGQRARRQPASPHDRRGHLADPGRPRPGVPVRHAGGARPACSAAGRYTAAGRYYSGRQVLFTDQLHRRRRPDARQPDARPLVRHQHVRACRTRSRRAPTRGSSTGSNGPSVFLTDMTLTKIVQPDAAATGSRRASRPTTLFNNIVWDIPDPNISSANFGKVTRKRIDGTGREIQFGLRFVF